MKMNNKFNMRHYVALTTILVLLCSATVIADNITDQTISFRSAKPIWPKGRQTEMNLSVGFRTVFKQPKNSTAVLQITASSVYRVFLNGVFLGYGPARGPRQYYRVDQWPLNNLKAENIIAVEVAGYNVNSYYILDQPSFIQAEVIADGNVLASTAGQGVGFEASILRYRTQKVQRYSAQRTFIEYYKMQPDYDRWRRDKSAPFQIADCAIVADRELLPRRVGYPRFLLRQPNWWLTRGSIETDPQVKDLWKGRELTGVGSGFKGYTEKQLEVTPSIELQKIKTLSTTGVNKPYSPVTPIDLNENSFAVLDMGTNLTGFIGANITCAEKTRLFFTFDEILTNGDVNFRRLKCINAVGYELEPGCYALEAFEPYTMRYLKLLVLKGSARVTGVCLREYANSETDQADFACSDMRLNRIFEAARQTFRQNAIDIFMDCPSRERAGWLCDSFFTSRVAFDLCGNTTIEKNFFENFLLPAHFRDMPDGMLPMCYPADHYNGRFIPNWAMWFVIELEEYLHRSGDRQMVDNLRPKVMSLLKYFEKFRNQDGLLEKLESWVFVEWSKANKFVQDVSYPSNMLYAAVLSAAGRLYDRPELIRQAEKIRQVIRKQSFDGRFFTDNAVRKDGKIEVTKNQTEVCQYFAFYFGLADPNKYGRLWNTLQTDFGPKRAQTKAYPNVYPANAFVGNYLRLELLSRYGFCRQLKNEIVDYFLYMADKTGTLWEHTRTSASCNHGFASHVGHCLYRDVLGIYSIDTQKKIVELRFTDIDLQWCRGKIPTRYGPISLRWWTESDKILYQVDLPAGFILKVRNSGGKQLTQIR